MPHREDKMLVVDIDLSRPATRPTRFSDIDAALAVDTVCGAAGAGRV